MAEAHPPVTWADMKAWAEANGVTDDAIITDQRGIKIRDLDFIEAQYGDPAEFKVLATWGRS